MGWDVRLDSPNNSVYNTGLSGNLTPLIFSEHFKKCSLYFRSPADGLVFVEFTTKTLQDTQDTVGIT